MSVIFNIDSNTANLWRLFANLKNWQRKLTQSTKISRTKWGQENLREVRFTVKEKSVLWITNFCPTAMCFCTQMIPIATFRAKSVGVKKNCTTSFLVPFGVAIQSRQQLLLVQLQLVLPQLHQRSKQQQKLILLQRRHCLRHWFLLLVRLSPRFLHFLHLIIQPTSIYQSFWTSYCSFALSTCWSKNAKKQFAAAFKTFAIAIDTKEFRQMIKPNLKIKLPFWEIPHANHFRPWHQAMTISLALALTILRVAQKTYPSQEIQVHLQESLAFWTHQILTHTCIPLTRATRKHLQLQHFAHVQTHQVYVVQ